MADALRQHDQVVSFDSEELILVDSNDREIGHANKAVCHTGHGTLHRAFSLFVFNPQGQLLLQRRAPGKRLWPGFWANSCCSHPRYGETLAVATGRRLEQELGMHSQLRYLYKFEYQADFGQLGGEHELCHVFVGQSPDPVRANATEIDAWRYISVDDLDAEIATYPEHFTPWLKLEWAHLREHCGAALPGAAQP